MSNNKYNIEEVSAWIAKEVEPQFANHGGRIKVLSLEDDILKFELMGECHNCPSAAAETEDFISVKVKSQFPEIKDVVLVTGVSDDLLDMARQILSHSR